MAQTGLKWADDGTLAGPDGAFDHLQTDWQSPRRENPVKSYKVETTVRYLGVDLEDALTLAEGTEI